MPEIKDISWITNINENVNLKNIEKIKLSINWIYNLEKDNLIWNNVKVLFLTWSDNFVDNIDFRFIAYSIQVVLLIIELII